MSNADNKNEIQMLFGHPKGLWFMFGTEMWERFGYYLMLGIFSLYMLDGWNNGGMGFDGQLKSDIYGTYLGLVYLTPFIGGLLADRLLGYRRSIIIGGLMMAAGYFMLAMHTIPSFYIALLLIILGNGFFKPNISTLVGNLYSEESLKDKKDAGFNIFYMGINIGAFVCNFVAAFMIFEVGQRGIRRLQHGAHCPIEDKNALVRSLFERAPSCLPIHHAPPGSAELPRNPNMWQIA